MNHTHHRTRTWLVTAAIVAGVGLGSFGIAAAVTGTGPADSDPNEAPDTAIAARDLDQATKAALDHTGEGTVTDTEVGDEDSYYEIEVTLDDGSQVDVQLDEDFKVVGSSADQEGGIDD